MKQMLENKEIDQAFFQSNKMPEDAFVDADALTRC